MIDFLYVCICLNVLNMSKLIEKQIFLYLELIKKKKKDKQRKVILKSAGITSRFIESTRSATSKINLAIPSLHKFVFCLHILLNLSI